MSKCISSHGEYSEHEPGDPCPWCGEYDMPRIIAERDEALARIKAVLDVLDWAESRTPGIKAEHRAVHIADIRRALGSDPPPRSE